jgi:hypothetical protein
VAELIRGGDVVGYMMMSVPQWSTEKGWLWRKRLVDARDLPELELSFLEDQRSGVPTTWWTSDERDVARVYDECLVRGRMEWEGVTYDLRWLDSDRAAAVRAERFWEPDEG